MATMGAQTPQQPVRAAPSCRETLVTRAGAAAAIAARRRKKMKLLGAIQRGLRGEAVEGRPVKFPPPVATLIGFEPVKLEGGAAGVRAQGRGGTARTPPGARNRGSPGAAADGAGCG